MKDRVWLWSPQNRSATSEHFPSLPTKRWNLKIDPEALAKQTSGMTLRHVSRTYDRIQLGMGDGQPHMGAAQIWLCQLWSVLVLCCDDCLHAEKTLCPTFSRWRSEGWNYSYSCPASLRWRSLNWSTGSRTAWRTDVMQCGGHLAIRSNKGAFCPLTWRND